MPVDLDQTSSTLPRRLGLFLARFCISAWIGAASLFVVVGVREVTRGGFDSSTKDALVAIRFPAFYAFGVTLVGTAWMGAAIARGAPGLTSRRRRVAISMLTVVLALMAIDYFWVFQPLLRMVDPPGQAKPIDFVVFHEASKWINLAGLLFSLVAALIVNWSGTNAEKE
jgi:hypothetical protein